MTLGAHLEALYASTDRGARLAADPVAFAHRYADPRDAEIAGLIAALMAFGRVDLFRPVVAAVLDVADRAGGPRAWVEGFDPHPEAFDGLYYRWVRPVDLAILAGAIGVVVRRYGGLEAAFAGEDAQTSLRAGLGALRAAAVQVAPRCGWGELDVPAMVRSNSAPGARPCRESEGRAGTVAAGGSGGRSASRRRAESDGSAFGALPRGIKHLLPSADGGSACKRPVMFLRWMIRPPIEGIDLGLWGIFPPSRLVIPLDTHVLRIAQLVGLTARTDGSWRTAVEVTEALRAYDADDPVRFDFSIAHLGISGQCKGRWDADVCPGCALRPVCREAR